MSASKSAGTCSYGCAFAHGDEKIVALLRRLNYTQRNRQDGLPTLQEHEARMIAFPSHWHKRLNGHVTVEKARRSSSRTPRSAAPPPDKYIWHLPYQIASLLPPNFQFSFECTTDASGMRRFAPLPSSDEFLPWASVVGHFILEDRGEQRTDLPFSYHEFRLFNSFVRHTQEFIGATPLLGTTLHTTRAGRLSDDREDRDILPQHIGLDVHGRGGRWAQRKFRQEGRAAAAKAGIKMPSDQEILVYGLTRAAERAPLAANDAEIRGLIRMALFTLGPPADKPNQEVLNYVAKHVIADLRKHLDDSKEEFRRWVEDSKSDVIHRIAKRRDCPTSRPGVRQAILELGVQSFWIQGECVDAAMRAFQAALPAPLKGYESQLFELLYHAQPQFGNLPLVMLKDRFPFLRPAMLRVWSNPTSKKATGILFRVITWFAEMLDNRRAADRQRKSRRNSDGKTTEHSGIVVEPKQVSHSRVPAAIRDQLQPLIEARLKIDLEASEWDLRIIGDEDDDPVTLVVSVDELPDRELLVTRQVLGEMLGFKKDKVKSKS